MIILYKMLFLLLLLVVPLATGDRIVATNKGPVKGILLKDRKVTAFLGIPYAEPPVGSLRFAKPVPKTPWRETYNAVELPARCVQTPYGDETLYDKSKPMNEDCLYLNMWVPEGGSNQKPIMVWIHGGGYMVGSSNAPIYNGATLSEHGDVIVATINYRVGTMGFFSAFIDEANGNMAMYDQLMAMQWIKDNARHFGGNPDNIVLFGESAGSYSVSLHMVSPLSRNLFTRAILESGSSFHPMYSKDNEGLFQGSQLVARILGCADDEDALKKNPKRVVDCMKALPAEKISEGDSIFFPKNGLLFPRVGDDFLPVTPVESFRNGKFKECDTIIGSNQVEGSYLQIFFNPNGYGIYGENVNYSSFDENSAKATVQALTRLSGDDEIVRGYFDRAKNDPSYTYLDCMNDIVGDYLITCGAVFESDFRWLKNTTVYYYLFTYRPPASPYAEWVGATHFDEVQYVFGNSLYKPFTDYEKKLSRRIMNMWTAFAKTGNPNVVGELNWPRYSYEDPKYLTIGEKPCLGQKPDNYRCERWRKFFGSEIDREVLQKFCKY